MTATQPLPNLENTLGVRHWLLMNKGVRPSDGFPMVQVYVDGEWHAFKSHKSAASFIYDIVSEATFEVFRNVGGGLTIKCRESFFPASE